MKRSGKINFFRAILFLLVFVWLKSAHGQTCTLSGSGLINWNNSAVYNCEEGGTSSEAPVIVVPSEMTLNFNDNADTWVGTRIEVNGTLNINANGQVTLNSNILIKNLGSLFIDNKLNLGSSEGCGYTFIVEDGGYFDIENGASNRLNICGKEIVKAGGGNCDDYPGSDLPYCEPPGGFPAPLAFNEDGSSPFLLPVELLFFKVSNYRNQIFLTWQTATELNNDYFTLERSKDGINYSTIARVRGYGTIQAARFYKFIDENPFPGLSYYRLKQTDFDGTTETFRPVSIVIEKNNSNASIYPNPLTGNELYVAFNEGKSDTDVTLSIFNIGGVKIFESVLNAENQHRISKFDVGILSKGAYIVNLRSSSFIQNMKLVRE